MAAFGGYNLRSADMLRSTENNSTPSEGNPVDRQITSQREQTPTGSGRGRGRLQPVDINDKRGQPGITRQDMAEVNNSLELLKQIKEEAVLMGLSGGEMKEYIEERRREERQIQLEREREERQIQLEREEREFRLEELRIQNSGQGQNRNNSNSQNSISSDVKMPYFDDKDDIEAYLLQFERFARNAGWKKENWAAKLGVLLKGQARLAYSRMEEEEAEDYDSLKKTLLEKYQLDDEAYRKKFRTTKKSHKETYKEYASLLTLWCERWISLANRDESVEELKDLMVQEQFLSSLPFELQVFIKDRKPESARKMAELATEYEHNRQGIKPGGPRGGHGNFKDRNSVTKQQNQSDVSDEEKVESKKEKERKTRDWSSVVCFKCDKKGHCAKMCPGRDGGPCHAVM